MPFPISLAGSFIVEPAGAPDQYALRLKAEISRWLLQKHARTISDAAQCISFKAGIFRFVSSWNPLVAISSGEIEVELQGGKIKVTYRFWFTEILIIATAMVGLFLGPSLFLAPNLTKMHAFLLLLFSWLWLFGGNYLLTMFRVPNTLKRIAQETKNATAL